uniref:Uncharacterized protein n=1 Tax=Octopus bimaculoides TaxID=37653 RepID=A0A0L8ICP9_OCTBM
MTMKQCFRHCRLLVIFLSNIFNFQWCLEIISIKHDLLSNTMETIMHQSIIS